MKGNKSLFYTCEIYLSLYQFTYKGQRPGRKEGHCFLCTQGKKSKSPQRTPVLSDSTTRSLSCHCISCCSNKTRNTDIVINFEMKERKIHVYVLGEWITSVQGQLALDPGGRGLPGAVPGHCLAVRTSSG